MTLHVSILSLSYSKGHVDVMKVLIADGHCKVDPTNNNGDTPLHEACR